MARYEHQRPGELCILDIKRFHRLGHTCTATVDSNPRASAGRIDDHAREFYRDERGLSGHYPPPWDHDRPHPHRPPTVPSASAAPVSVLGSSTPARLGIARRPTARPNNSCRRLEWAYLRAPMPMAASAPRHGCLGLCARLGLSLNDLSALHTQAGLRVRSAGISPKSAEGHRPRGKANALAPSLTVKCGDVPSFEAHAPSAHARVSGSHFDAPPS